MQKVENADASKGLGDEMCKNRGSGVGVHGCKLGNQVVELGESVDGDEDVRYTEALRVPEDHPYCTWISHRS